MSILIPGRSSFNPSEKKPIYARSGWPIPIENPPMGDIRLMANRSKELSNWFPTARIRSISVYPYNCVGMIFAARRAWIEIDHIYDILNQDGYHLINRQSVVEGDIVLYKYRAEPTHVGIIIASAPVSLTSTILNIQVLSKWGRDPEFIHFIEDVPSLIGQPSEFYSERVEL